MPPHCGNKHLQFCRKITAKTHKSPSTQQGSAQSPAVEERAARCRQPPTAWGPVWGPTSTGGKAFSHQNAHFQPQIHKLVKNFSIYTFLAVSSSLHPPTLQTLLLLQGMKEQVASPGTGAASQWPPHRPPQPPSPPACPSLGTSPI